MADFKEQLANLGIRGIAAGHEGFKAVGELMQPDETLMAIVPGEYDGKYAAMAATDRRVLVVGRSVGLFKKTKNEEFLYSNITNVEMRTGKVQGSITVAGAGNSATLDKVINVSIQPFVTKVRQLMTQARAPQPMAAAPVDVAGQLEKLANLRERGVLSDSEFQAQKAKLLH